MFNIATTSALHFFIYNLETNTCETRGKVKINAQVIATHWHDDVFSIVEKHGEQPIFRLRRYYPAIDKIENVSVGNLEAHVRFKVIAKIGKRGFVGPFEYASDRF